MASFDYKAKDRAGNTVAGSVEAGDERAAAAMLRKMGYLPMDIRAARGARQPARSPEAGSPVARYLVYTLWTGVNMKQLLLFYRQLETLLASGMSLSESLRSIGSRARGRLGRIVLEAEENVRAGRQLSETMSRYPRVFMPLQISLIRAGEAGGLLQPMIERIAAYLEYELSVRQRIMKVTLYPLLIFVFIVLIPHVPALVLNGGMAFLRSLWGAVGVWLPWAVLGLIVIKLLFQFHTTRLVWDFIKIQPPVLGAMARKIAMSRFSRALAVLYAAGMSMGEAVAISADACANAAVGRGLRCAVPAIQSGHRLTESLVRTRMLMPMVLDMLSTGEKTGSTDTVLQKVADYMDDEVDSTIHKTGIALFVLMILVAGWFVLQMLIGFYSGYFQNLMNRAGDV